MRLKSWYIQYQFVAGLTNIDAFKKRKYVYSDFCFFGKSIRSCSCIFLFGFLELVFFYCFLMYCCCISFREVKNVMNFFLLYSGCGGGGQNEIIKKENSGRILGPAGKNIGLACIIYMDDLIVLPKISYLSLLSFASPSPWISISVTLYVPGSLSIKLSLSVSLWLSWLSDSVFPFSHSLPSLLSLYLSLSAYTHLLVPRTCFDHP